MELEEFEAAKKQLEKELAEIEVKIEELTTRQSQIKIALYGPYMAGRRKVLPLTEQVHEEVKKNPGINRKGILLGLPEGTTPELVTGALGRLRRKGLIRPEGATANVKWYAVSKEHEDGN